MSIAIGKIYVIVIAFVSGLEYKKIHLANQSNRAGSTLLTDSHELCTLFRTDVDVHEIITLFRTDRSKAMSAAHPRIGHNYKGVPPGPRSPKITAGVVNNVLRAF